MLKKHRVQRNARRKKKKKVHYFRESNVSAWGNDDFMAISVKTWKLRLLTEKWVEFFLLCHLLPWEEKQENTVCRKIKQGYERVYTKVVHSSFSPVVPLQSCPCFKTVPLLSTGARHVNCQNAQAMTSNLGKSFHNEWGRDCSLKNWFSKYFVYWRMRIIS